MGGANATRAGFKPRSFLLCDIRIVGAGILNIRNSFTVNVYDSGILMFQGLDTKL